MHMWSLACALPDIYPWESGLSLCLDPALPASSPGKMGVQSYLQQVASCRRSQEPVPGSYNPLRKGEFKSLLQGLLFLRQHGSLRDEDGSAYSTRTM